MSKIINKKKAVTQKKAAQTIIDNRPMLKKWHRLSPEQKMIGPSFVWESNKFDKIKDRAYEVKK